MCLQVYDHDRFSKDDIIGEVIIPMLPSDLVNGQTWWKNIQHSEGRTVRRLSLDPKSPQSLKPNTHRRRGRDETVESRRVGGVYTNSQLVGDSFVVSSV